MIHVNIDKTKLKELIAAMISNFINALPDKVPREFEVIIDDEAVTVKVEYNEMTARLRVDMENVIEKLGGIKK